MGMRGVHVPLHRRIRYISWSDRLGPAQRSLSAINEE